MSAGVGVVHGKAAVSRGDRGKVGGWSEGSARRNAEWLQTVRYGELGNRRAWAYTFTVREAPAAGDWRLLVRRLQARLDRMGVVRRHWVVEWTARGVPHLHMALWFRQGLADVMGPVAAWRELAAEWEAGEGGQRVEAVRGAKAWAQYCGRHGSRGLRHYQRCRGNLPIGWEDGGAGRVWGFRGEWPVGEVVVYRMSAAEWYVLRRRFRRWARVRRRRGGVWRGWMAWDCQFLLRGLSTEAV